MAAFVGRYATAFLEVVTAAHLDTSALDRQLTDFMATWDGSSELREFFANPAVPSTQKVTVLDKLNAKLGMQRELRNLIAVLINNDRIGSVSEVAAAYRKLLQEQLGIKPAEITTARELSKAEQDKLAGEVGKLAGARIDASFKLDPAILGGTVVRIGSTVYDGSVRGRLERLKESLIAG
ncbi:MAG TPA: ATP synthase F1 subunit delta [Terracidiphilus sp.]|jgi:F-type H+-transporting ATPase subunit delta|nr:ATP synthase F1 subunit delta [Terracidiphilus sp.]